MDDGSLLIIFALVILIMIYLLLPFTEHIAQYLGRRREMMIRLYDELNRVEKTISKIKEKIPQSEKTFDGEKILHYYQGLKEYIVHSINFQKQTNILAAGDELFIMPQMNSNNSDDFLEEIIASYKRKKEERAGGFCTKCGSPIHKGDKFCWSCGVKIE